MWTEIDNKLLLILSTVQLFREKKIINDKITYIFLNSYEIEMITAKNTMIVNNNILLELHV